MNKSELIVAVSKKADISKKDAEKAVCALFDIIVDEVSNGQDIRIVHIITVPSCRPSSIICDGIAPISISVYFEIFHSVALVFHIKPSFHVPYYTRSIMRCQYYFLVFYYFMI